MVYIVYFNLTKCFGQIGHLQAKNIKFIKISLYNFLGSGHPVVFKVQY